MRSEASSFPFDSPLRTSRLAALGAALALALAGAPARAQGVCYQENGGPTYNDATFFLQGVVAVRVAMPAEITATGLQVFTGESSGIAKVFVWRDDAANEQPGALIEDAAFTTQIALGFQGADFAAPIPLHAGAVYWVGWTLPILAQSPVDSPKQTLGQLYRTTSDGGATWNGPFEFNNSHHKFRILGPCGASDGYTVAYGTGCGGATLPAMLGGGVPSGGHVIAARVEHGPPAAVGVFTLGSGTGTLGVAGCVAQNLPLTAQVPIALDASGELQLAAALPPGLGSFDLYLQVYLADPSAAGGLATTNPVQAHFE